MKRIISIIIATVALSTVNSYAQGQLTTYHSESNGKDYSVKVDIADDSGNFKYTIEVVSGIDGIDNMVVILKNSDVPAFKASLNKAYKAYIAYAKKAAKKKAGTSEYKTLDKIHFPEMRVGFYYEDAWYYDTCTILPTLITDEGVTSLVLYGTSPEYRDIYAAGYSINISSDADFISLMTIFDTSLIETHLTEMKRIEELFN